MDGFVFLAAVAATLVVVIVISVGKRIDRPADQPEHPMMFPLILASSCFVLAGVYFADVHPVIGNTVAIITGFAACCGALLLASWLVRFLKQALRR